MSVQKRTARLPDRAETMAWRNWAGNQRATPTRVARPRGVEEIAAIIREAGEVGHRVKAVGSGHSFTAVAATDGIHIDLGLMSGIMSADGDSGRVRVLAGTPLHVLNRALAAEGLSMTNLGDIDRQTVAGALSTGTHGTGIKVGGLATQVRAIELVLADGSVATCNATEDPDLFAAARVGLGALGVLSAVELQCEPEYALSAREMPMPLPEVLENIHELAQENDHFEFFWFPYTDTALTKVNNRLPDDAPREPLHPVRAWLEDELFANTVFGLTCRITRRWPSFTPRVNRFAGHLLSTRQYADTAYKVFCSSRRVRFVEAEYAIPRQFVVEGITRIRKILERRDLRVSFPIEVRFAAADDIPLSTAYGRDSAYLAIHMFEGQAHEDYFMAVELALAELGARPHWGKLHSRTAEDLRELYPRFDDFLDVRNRVDQEGRFANDYLDRILGPVPTT